MTDPDETISDINDVDALLERLLAGGDPGPDAPPWTGNLALLVRAAQAPPRPDELAGEDDIVRRMGEARLAALAGDDPTTDPAVATGSRGPVVAAGTGPSAPGHAAMASVTDLGDHRARHGRDRTYRAKHAAARLEASRHPAVRTLGRVIAMKAAAVTTAVVIGVAAAAAATTGIVATVVVPALSSNEPRKPDPPPVSTERPQGPSTIQDVGGGTPAWAEELSQLGCPMLPSCAELLLPARPPQPTASTSVPSTTPTTLAAEGTTPPETTTTVPETTTTTVPETTTTVPETTTTTVPETPPDPLVTPLSAPGDGPSHGSTTSAPVDAP